MFRSRNLLSRRSCIGFLLTLVFAIIGLQPKFNLGNLSVPLFANQAVAGVAANEGDEGRDEKTCTTYKLRVILNMAPRQLKELYFSKARGGDGAFYIAGFSTELSERLLLALTLDVSYVKGLLREMRDAKSEKARRKILEKHGKAIAKEDKEITEEWIKLMNSPKTKFNDGRLIENGRRRMLNNLKGIIIKKWLRNLDEGKKLKCLQ